MKSKKRKKMGEEKEKLAGDKANSHYYRSQSFQFLHTPALAGYSISSAKSPPTRLRIRRHSDHNSSHLHKATSTRRRDRFLLAWFSRIERPLKSVPLVLMAFSAPAS